MIPIQTYIFKATAFCNLNCTYCYIFNLQDHSYRGKPKIMPMEIVEQSAKRITQHAILQGMKNINVVFHGGEPLLAGRRWMREVVDGFRRTGGEEVGFNFSVQTNGVLVDAEWVRLFRELGIAVSLSMDGPRHINDRARVNFAGRGSYDEVVRGLRFLLGEPFFGGVLCVVDPESSGLEIYRHFRELGLQSMDFLLPLDHNWDNLPPGHQNPAATPYADYLIPIFDEWWTEDDPAIRVRLFETILGHLVGSSHGVDSLGGHPISFGIIDTDGSLEPLDSLRACGENFTSAGLNVREHAIESLYNNDVFRDGLQGQAGLSEVCQACQLHDVCGAGYLPHRYSRERGFRNPSIYCRDLWKVITHVLDAAFQRLVPDAQGYSTAVVESSHVGACLAR